MEIKINYKTTILLIIFIILSYLLVFLHLGSQGVKMWDESIYAINAFEMFQNGNYLERYFLGHIDTWATQAPFTTWFQVLSMKLFGVNEVSLRLPSALSAIILSFYIIYFTKKNFNDLYLGFCISTVLLTSYAYTNDHIVRTGDLDGLLTFFLALSFLTFYKYVQSDCNSRNNLYLTSLFITCAVFTKSIAGFFFLPGMLLMLLFERKNLKILKRKEFYFSIFIFLFFIFLYNIIREINMPGYISHTLKRQIADRFFNVDEGHNESFYFYLVNFYNGRLYFWVYLIPFSILFSYKNKLAIYSIITSLFFLFIISFSKTKIEHYDAPIYPLLALINGIGIYNIFKFLLSFIKTKYKVICCLCLIILIFFLPSYKIIKNNLKVKDDWNETNYSYMMKKIKNENPDIKKILILLAEWNSHVYFYTSVYNQLYNYSIKNIDVNNGFPELNEHDIIMFNRNEIFTKLNKYRYKTLKEYKNIFLVEIESKLKI